MFSFRTAFRRSFADAIILLVYFARSTLINTLPPLIGNNFHQNLPTKRNRSSSLKIPILVQFLDQWIFYNLAEFFSLVFLFPPSFLSSSLSTNRLPDETLARNGQFSNKTRTWNIDDSMTREIDEPKGIATSTRRWWRESSYSCFRFRVNSDYHPPAMINSCNRRTPRKLKLHYPGPGAS